MKPAVAAEPLLLMINPSLLQDLPKMYDLTLLFLWEAIASILHRYHSAVTLTTRAIQLTTWSVLRACDEETHVMNQWRIYYSCTVKRAGKGKDYGQFSCCINWLLTMKKIITILRRNFNFKEILIKAPQNGWRCEGKLKNG